MLDTDNSMNRITLHNIFDKNISSMKEERSK